MRVISVASLKGDEILGKQIYDESGRILLNAKVQLNPYFIHRITELGISSVYIEDELSHDIEIKESISEMTRQLGK